MMLNFKSLCATLDEVGLFLNTITHCATSAVTATTTATKTTAMVAIAFARRST